MPRTCRQSARPAGKPVVNFSGLNVPYGIHYVCAVRRKILSMGDTDMSRTRT